LENDEDLDMDLIYDALDAFNRAGKLAYEGKNME
jgi:hypothetical protein